MMIIPLRAIEWVNRWSAHGLKLGRHDGNGNPVFGYEAGDSVAEALIAELEADSIMRHAVTIIIAEMVAAAHREGGFE